MFLFILNKMNTKLLNNKINQIDEIKDICFLCEKSYSIRKIAFYFLRVGEYSWPNYKSVEKDSTGAPIIEVDAEKISKRRGPFKICETCQANRNIKEVRKDVMKKYDLNK